MQSDLMWIVGVVHHTDDFWMAEGLFYNEEDAVASCKDNEFVLCVKAGERFPVQATDAIKLYWPKKKNGKTVHCSS